jgi:hypothetical protein
MNPEEGIMKVPADAPIAEILSHFQAHKGELYNKFISRS